MTKQIIKKKVRGMQLRTLRANGTTEGVFRFESIEDAITQAVEKERERLIEEIDNKNFELMESCEPDCDDVRHARHEGSWKHYKDMEKFLDKLTNRQSKTNTKSLKN